MNIVGWLTGRTDVDLPDPLETADRAIRAFSRQRRYEEAENLRQACEHLLNMRRSYETLAEARRLRFATVWPVTENGRGRAVRLNLVWDGRLSESVSLDPAAIEESVAAVLEPLWEESIDASAGALSTPVAVPQRELDSLLAVRRWYCETEHYPKVQLPGPGTGIGHLRELYLQLATEARRLLQSAPS